MVCHVESGSGLRAVTWEGERAGQGAYRRKEGGKRAPLYRELGGRLRLAVNGMSLISSK